MGTKLNPGKYDCYANAEPDEPMFVLLGRDPSAALLVRLWALIRHRNVERPDTREAEKVAEALHCANTMDDYPKTRTPLDQALVEKLLIAVTEGMNEHPEDFDHACDCVLCRSYE